jgi:NADH-quinone oxidoreductase subunit C
MSPEPFITYLREQRQSDIEAHYETQGLHTLVIKRGSLVALCGFLKQDPKLRFNFLSDICGVDFYPQTPRFEVVYHLYSIPFKYRLRLKCKLEEDQSIASVTCIWKTANWHEREAYDMYGIVFEGHPYLKRIYLWEGFEGYPLRKDFPLKGYKDEYNPFGEEHE